MNEQNLIRKILTKILIILFVSILYISQASALDVKTQVSSSELPENEDISFDIEISDYDYASYISVETGIIKKGNEPIFDFGELNEKYANIDKYKQSVILDVPKDSNSFKIKISGKTPSGIEMSKTGNIEIATFVDENVKYYDVKLIDDDKKITGQKKSKIFRIIVNEKILFEKNLKNIKWDELDDAKMVAKDMFNRGLVTDAKKLVYALDKITPENEDILPYKEIWKNVTLVLGIIIVTWLVYRKGYLKGLEDR